MGFIYQINKGEAETESCFTCEVEFHYPHNQDALTDLLDEFKKRSRSDEMEGNDLNVNIFGEKTTHDRLIVTGNVSGLADESKKLASFLTVARKYRYSCVYIFHTIFPVKATWR